MFLTADDLCSAMDIIKQRTILPDFAKAQLPSGPLAMLLEELKLLITDPEGKKQLYLAAQLIGGEGALLNYAWPGSFGSSVGPLKSYFSSKMKQLTLLLAILEPLLQNYSFRQGFNNSPCVGLLLDLIYKCPDSDNPPPHISYAIELVKLSVSETNTTIWQERNLAKSVNKLMTICMTVNEMRLDFIAHVFTFLAKLVGDKSNEALKQRFFTEQRDNLVNMVIQILQ